MKTFIKNHKKIFSAAIILTVLISSVIVFASQKIKKTDAAATYEFTNSLGEKCSLFISKKGTETIVSSKNSSTDILTTITYNSDTEFLKLKTAYVHGKNYKSKGTASFDIGAVYDKMNSLSTKSICYIPNKYTYYSYQHNGYGDGYSKITHSDDFKIPSNNNNYIIYSASIFTLNNNLKSLTNSSKGAIELTFIADLLDMDNTSDIEYVASFIDDIDTSDISSAAQITQQFYRVEKRFTVAIADTECTKQ